MSERDLAAGVLLQAVEDFNRPEPAKRGTKGGISKAWREWDDARKFCTDSTGGWAKSRNEWCYLAGIDPVAFLERCTKMQDALAEAA